MCLSNWEFRKVLFSSDEYGRCEQTSISKWIQNAYYHGKDGYITKVVFQTLNRLWSSMRLRLAACLFCPKNKGRFECFFLYVVSETPKKVNRNGRDDDFDHNLCVKKKPNYLCFTKVSIWLLNLHNICHRKKDDFWIERI